MPAALESVHQPTLLSLDPQLSWTVDSASFLYQGKEYANFQGRRLTGKAVATFVGRRLIMQNGDVLL